MIYRIDLQHFLTHAIDYFSRDELSHFQYAIISAKIANNGRELNVTKLNNLYPTPDIVLSYAEYKDKKILEKMYTDLLTVHDSNDEWIGEIIYKSFVNPLIHHHDVVIICDRTENDYIDILCKHLKKNYEIEVINLNQLFSEGRVGPIYIDRDVIWDKAVDIRRTAGKHQIEAMSSTRDGRMKLLSLWNKKEKIAKLKELGIKVNKGDMKELDKLLIDAWVEDESND